MTSIVNIAAYKFLPLDRLEMRRDSLRSLCKVQQLKGTVLLSSEGINMFVAGSRESIDAFLAEVRGIPGLESLEVKESLTDYQPFNRMLVRLKREIIPVGCDGIAPEPDASPKIAPKQLKQWLDENKPVTLLDTRNDYEIDLGTFDGAIDLRLKNFRQFPVAAASLPDSVKKQPVVMFCTGGIRCEKIGPYMKGLGFEEIYQLEGGILKYFEECEQSHYHGECFVFDQRVAVDPHLDPSAADECYACKHVLTPEDLESPMYKIAVSCPYCYRSDESVRAEEFATRQASIVAIASEQRGCTPYENKRWMSIPQRCAGQTLVDALAEIYPGYTREQWTDVVRRGEMQSPVAGDKSLVTVAATEDRIVREGERFLHIQPDYTEPPINPHIELIHHDSAIVVVNKSAPLPLHPSGRFNRNTLEAILDAAYHPEKLRPAHRLDANTTGLVVFARKFSFASRLQPQFAEGRVDKVYMALIDGHPTWDETRCELAIDDTPLANGGRALHPNGLAAFTTFRVMSRNANGQTVCEVRPEQGRTHQIRLHAAALGFPIVNDPLYLAGGESRPTPDSERAASALSLHAWRIAFDHPQTGERVTFEARCPFYS